MALVNPLSEDEQFWAAKAVRAGVHPKWAVTMLVIAHLTEKSVLDVANTWHDCAFGYQMAQNDFDSMIAHQVNQDMSKGESDA